MDFEMKIIEGKRFFYIKKMKGLFLNVSYELKFSMLLWSKVSIYLSIQIEINVQTPFKAI